MVVVLAAQSARPAETPSVPAPVFLTSDFSDHVSYLASDELAGRLPGSEGAAKAADYIIRHFQQAGLMPLQADGLKISILEEGQVWKTDPLNMHKTGSYNNSVVWVGTQK